MPDEIVDVLLKVVHNGNPWAHRQIIPAAAARPTEDTGAHAAGHDELIVGVGVATTCTPTDEANCAS